MPKRVSQEEFISRCHAFHGNKYDYSKTIYVAAKKAIVVGCPEHGFFKTLAFNHATQTGCPRCGYERSQAAKWSSREKFIEQALIVHGNRYDYSKVVYQGSATDVILGCSSHGWFNQQPNNHLFGKGCNKCGLERLAKVVRTRVLSASEFFKRCTDLHDGYYSYPEQAYNGTLTLITVNCPVHGHFEIPANNHLRLKNGCQKCGYDKASLAKRKTVESWTQQARVVHGTRYEYNTTGWNGTRSFVQILCKKHGWWKQKAQKHAQGHGCPRCAHERLMGRWQPETMSEEYASEQCCFYYMHILSSDESFYKIGISNNVERRRKELCKYGYAIHVILKISSTRKSCCETEKSIFEKFDSVAGYIPKIKFPGSSECFSYDILNLEHDNHDIERPHVLNKQHTI